MISVVLLSTLLGGGCGQNAHVLGPPSGGAIGTPPDGSPPGGRTDPPTDSPTDPGNPSGPPTDPTDPNAPGNPPGGQYPPGYPKPPGNKPGPIQIPPAQKCGHGVGLLRLSGRTLTPAESAQFGASEAGFAVEMGELAGLGADVKFHDVWLLIEGPAVPARGGAGSAICLVNGGICASLNGSDARRVRLSELFQGNDLETRLRGQGRAGVTLWSVPAAWSVDRATLQIELKGEGC